MSNPPAPFAKLLIVDDEVAQMTALCHTLQDEGYATFGFTTGHSALAALREQEFDIVLTDLMMPEMDRNLVGIVMTGHGAVETAVKAMQAGALDYIQKPFKLRQILPVLSRALTIRRLRTENIQLRQTVAIHELCSAFTKELHPDTIAAKVADAAQRQISDGRASVFVVAKDAAELRIAATRLRNASEVKTQRITIDRSLTQWLATAQQKLLSMHDATYADFNLPGNIDEFANTVSLPMVAGGEFVGILNCESESAARPLTTGQIKGLSILAATAASAIQVASLLERLNKANEELELRVKQRTVELESANKELETFSYSVSHDLRAPLRTIAGYADVLLQDYQAQLADGAQQAVESILSASQRMNELIGDLLRLAQLSQQNLAPTRVDTTSLVRQVLEELRCTHPNAAVDVRLGDLPACSGDESLLRQVFVNLLANAFKFTRRCEQPHIEINAQPQADELIYYIRDNGAGFDMAQAHKLFGTFQRLHHADEFEGTGVGLSIVQRIVNRHGGRVWAEGELGKGATFYFTVPKKMDDSLVKH
jgi:signal transduction histidine kinase